MKALIRRAYLIWDCRFPLIHSSRTTWISCSVFPGLFWRALIFVFSLIHKCLKWLRSGEQVRLSTLSLQNIFGVSLVCSGTLSCIYKKVQKHIGKVLLWDVAPNVHTYAQLKFVAWGLGEFFPVASSSSKTSLFFLYISEPVGQLEAWLVFHGLLKHGFIGKIGSNLFRPKSRRFVILLSTSFGATLLNNYLARSRLLILSTDILIPVACRSYLWSSGWVTIGFLLAVWAKNQSWWSVVTLRKLLLFFRFPISKNIE